MANIGELPYGVLGTAPKFGSAKKLNLSLCLRPPNNVAKRIFFTVVFVQVVKKSPLDVQNLLFFLLLIGFIAVAVTVAFVFAPRIYRLVWTVRNSNTVLVKTPAIFSLDIYSHVCYPRFGPLLIDLLRFSGNRHLGGEGRKVVVVEKIYISKKQPELNELRQTVLLK